MNEELKGRLRGLISRKFFIVLIATAAMFTGYITGLAWGGIALAYLTADQLETNIAKKSLGREI